MKRFYSIMSKLGFVREDFSKSDYTIYSWKNVFEVVHQHHDLRWVLIQSKFFAVEYQTFNSLKWFKLGADIVLDIENDFGKKISFGVELFIIDISIEVGFNLCYPFEGMCIISDTAPN